MTSAFKSLLYLYSLLATLLFATSLSAYDLYWTEYADGSAVIMASDIDGQNAAPIVSGTDMASYAVDIAVTDSHIYWTGHEGGDVWRANRDGTQPERIIEPGGELALVLNLAIDEAAGKMYLADFANGIFSANLDGSGLTNLWSSNPTDYSGIALKNSSELLWVTTSTEWLYNQPVTPGAQPGAVELEGGTVTFGLAYDAGTDTVYYTNFEEGTLRSYNLGTNEGKLLHNGLVSPLGVKLSPDGTHLLIAERGRGISVFQIDNFGYQLLIDSAVAHFGVAVTANPAALPPGEPPVDRGVLFQASFEADPVGELPLRTSEGGVWSSIASNDNANGINRSHGITVETDEADIFGYGVDNKYLRIEDNSGGFIYGNLSDPTGVATLSFELYIMRTTITPPSGSERMGFGFFDASADRLHLLSVTPSDGRLRGSPSSTRNLTVLERMRLDIILNNTDQLVTYEDPSGAEKVLPPTMSHTWLDGELIAEYINARDEEAVTGDISQIRLPTHSSTDRLSIAIDNVTVFRGARVLEQLVEGVDPVFPPPPFGGHVEVDFEGIPTGEITRANIADFAHGNAEIKIFSTYDDEGNPLMQVVQDSENQFGEGTENQILRANGARNWSIEAANNFNEEVMTLRIDMIAESVSNGRLSSRFFNADGKVVSRLELRSGNTDSGAFGSDNSAYPELLWDYGVLNRFETVINNSANAITYATPRGGSKTLISGGTDLWLNGRLVFADSRDAYTASPSDPIMKYEIRAFSGNPWIGDIATLRTYAGVELVPVESAGGFADWLDAEFPGETDAAIIGADADPDGDGVSNLLEYALGLDPNAASREGLPVLGVGAFTVDGVEGEYLTLTATLLDAADFDFAVDVASELGDWAEGAGVAVGPGVSNGDGTTTYTFRDTEPVSSSERRFMRLSLSERIE